MSQTLRFLQFDRSSDAHGQLTLEAMASVGADRWPQLCAEVAQLLGWLHDLPGVAQGPLEEGGLWDVALDGSLERSQPMALAFAPEQARLEAQPLPGEVLRYSLSLSLSLAEPIGQALCEHFGIGQD